jgi:hypothetical protein
MPSEEQIQHSLIPGARGRVMSLVSSDVVSSDGKSCKCLAHQM